jgi:CCAAT-binding transcription factor (CBF-B/NF-YA) subunit B
MTNHNAYCDFHKRESVGSIGLKDIALDSLKYLKDEPYYIVDLPPTLKCILPPKFLEEEPLLVNPKQYERIIKRRIARSKAKDSTKKIKKHYKHESRHLHACKRERSHGGTFLPKDGDGKPKKKVKNSRYSAACVIYGQTPDD